MRRRAYAGLVLIAVAFVLPARAADVPPWLADAAVAPVPAHSAETEAVVLLDEQNTKVNLRGVITSNCRRAVMVLRQGGIEEARRLMLVSAYDTKIVSMTGWNLTQGRKTLKVTTKDVVETGLAPDTLYTDISMKILALPSVETGSVVGFEWEEERRPPSLEDIFEFQSGFPVACARYSLTLPPGWTMDAFWVNWPRQEAQRGTEAGPTVIWEMRDIPAIEKEPLMPDPRTLSGRLILRLKASLPDARCFSGWSDFGAWYEALSKDCRMPDNSVTQKAAELAAGSADTFSRLRAMAEFVQKDIRYVAIEIGIGGYKPHNAGSILYNRYGDCKDKATLLAALLQASGVASYYLLVNSERGYVTEASPVSLYSFNHVVLGIRLPDDVPDTDWPALMRHPRLGRLLVFDPTFPYTPLGHLPVYLQGNAALLVAEGSGEMIPLPSPLPKANRLERAGRFLLRIDGTLEGEIREARRGILADGTRYVLLNSTNEERTKFIETFLANFFAGFVLLSSEVDNLDDTARDLVFRYRFRVPQYAKSAGGMMIFRPRIVGDKRERLETNDNRPRRYPVGFDGPSEQTDEFTIELAAGFRVESLPPEAEIEPGFAVYRSKTEEDGRTLVYRREYRLIHPVLPCGQYEEAVKFFRAMDADQRQSVLLKK
jgi:hypothetical protein